MRVNREVNEERRIKVWSFPMRYQPVTHIDRSHVGPRWTWYELRAFQIMLQVTHGAVSGTAGYFEVAYGANAEEFKELLVRPLAFIWHRKHYTEGKGQATREEFERQWTRMSYQRQERADGNHRVGWRDRRTTQGMQGRTREQGNKLAGQGGSSLLRDGDKGRAEHRSRPGDRGKAQAGNRNRRRRSLRCGGSGLGVTQHAEPEVTIMARENQPPSWHRIVRPALTIPTDRRAWSSFCQRLTDLLAADGTHLYLDTSFLMWLTKIGGRSRNELFGWFDRTVPYRVHVPVWAAHEYLKHHINETLVKNFNGQRKEIQKFTRRTYGELRPFIDERFGQTGDDPISLRATIRGALNELDGTIEKVRHWTKQYQRHATDVMEFINQGVIQGSSIYAELEKVDGYADARLTASVPPGFKDLWKKGPEQEVEGRPRSGIRGNAYGDLILWKEVLNHAKARSATAVVLITNDIKNDWRMGGTQEESPDDPELRAVRGIWKPIPRPHPMLIFEAQTQASVRCLELIDNVYLGAYLREVAEQDTPAFADVALAQDFIVEETQDTERGALQGSDATELAELVSAENEIDRYLFAEPEGVHNTKAQLRKALLFSREELDPATEALLNNWRQEPNSRTSILERMDPALIEKLNHMQLAASARALHNCVLSGKSGYSEALADIVSDLDRMPPKTAAAIYLGLLASMYLSMPINTPRFPPSSPVRERIFQLQGHEFAKHAVTVISRHLHGYQERPLYVPTIVPETIVISVETEERRSLANQIASIRFSTENESHPAFPVELLEPVKTYNSLHLATLFGEETLVDGMAIIQKAGEIYTFPISQIEEKGLSDEGYIIPSDASFRDPRQIRIQKERE